MGFNGAITRSLGKGTIMGFARTSTGHRVALRVPDCHQVEGAPQDLLSVSGLVALGYEFHFTHSRAFMVTPEGFTIDLVQKAGLYWLRWRKAIDTAPPEQHSTSNAATNDMNAATSTRACEDADDDNNESFILRNEEPWLTHHDAGAEATAATLSAPVTATSTTATATAANNECFGAGAGPRASLPLLHRRLGHFGHDLLEKMSSERGFDVTLTDHTRTFCEVCKSNKLTRRHVPAQREQRTFEQQEATLNPLRDIPPRDVKIKAGTSDSRPPPSSTEQPVSHCVGKPFERVWTDLKGKLAADFWRNRYLVTFTCESTRWSCVYYCKRKSDVKLKFIEFLDWVERQGYQVRQLNSDGGGEYTANENASMLSEFEKICVARKINQQFTSANTASQNGISERLNRTLAEHAACLLHEAGLGKEFWSLAVKQIVWIRNRIYHRALRDEHTGASSSPFQRLYGRQPRVSMARVWGCDAWSLKTNRDKSSFDPKAKKGIFVGVSSNRKGWVILDPRTRKLHTTYHCAFNESFEERRCALRDFKLRPKKAGPGASKEEEQQAKLEAALYHEAAEVFDDELTASDVEAAEERAGAPACAEAEQPSKQQVSTAEQTVNGAEPEDIDKSSKQQVSTAEQNVNGTEPEDDDESPRQSDVDDSTEEERHESNEPQNGGRSLRTPTWAIHPKRRAAIGAPQELIEEDAAFLEFAFDHDFPLRLQQRNPKRNGSKSRLRYEGYKSARTLRDIKNLGGTWEDIHWDYCRGFIDFTHTEGTSLEELDEQHKARDISNSAAARVDQKGLVRTTGPFDSISLAESIQQDYAVMALEHIESLSHRAQRVLQRALCDQTLTQFAHCCASRIMIPEPLTFAEAMASEHACEWRAAMDEEISNLMKFDCYDKVPRTQAIEHGRLVKSKWVFKVKYNSDGTVQRFRARLVAKGFTQVPGSDFYETFSPVFSYTSFRAVLAIAAATDMQLDTWDLQNSFLQQKLDVEHMYMECPAGYSNVTDNGQPAALHLKQSIYGLKQASRLLHERLAAFLISRGFRQCISDRCVFRNLRGDIVCTWVDDIIMATARDDAIGRSKFDADLRSEFEMSPWTVGEADWILKMQIKRDWEKGALHLSQPGAIEKLAARFNLANPEERTPTVPMDPALKLTKPDEADIVPSYVFDYQSAVGGLLYLSLTARPDIAQSVGMLSRFMSCPAVKHVEAAKQVISYLYGTKNLGITYTRNGASTPHLQSTAERSESQKLVTYADADYAGDSESRKSTSGFAILLHGGVISWQSKLQSTVALSTAEAETMAGVDAVKQLMHLRLFLREIGLEQLGPSYVYEDNQAAISLAQGKEQSQRSKHYQIKVHFISEQRKIGIFDYVKVGTKDQLADTFTKPLGRDEFVRFRSWMGVSPPPEPTTVAASIKTAAAEVKPN